MNDNERGGRQVVWDGWAEVMFMIMFYVLCY